MRRVSVNARARPTMPPIEQRCFLFDAAAHVDENAFEIMFQTAEPLFRGRVS